MFSCPQRSYKEKGSTPQWKGLCPGPSWAVMWGCQIRGCTVHQPGLRDSFGILWLSWKQQPVCRVPLMLWGVHIHLLLLGSLQVGVRSGTILSSGEGAVSSLQSSNWEHRHITPHFTGAGEQTWRRLHVPSPPCQSVSIDNKLDLQNELSHPNQQLKQSKQILYL